MGKNFNQINFTFREWPKSWNGESANGMRGMMGTRVIRVGTQRIRLGTRGIRVETRGIRVGMRGIQECGESGWE